MSFPCCMRLSGGVKIFRGKAPLGHFETVLPEPSWEHLGNPRFLWVRDGVWIAWRRSVLSSWQRRVRGNWRHRQGRRSWLASAKREALGITYDEAAGAERTRTRLVLFRTRGPACCRTWPGSRCRRRRCLGDTPVSSEDPCRTAGTLGRHSRGDAAGRQQISGPEWRS
jgi:hypothetical protein